MIVDRVGYFYDVHSCTQQETVKIILAHAHVLGSSVCVCVCVCVCACVWYFSHFSQTSVLATVTQCPTCQGCSEFQPVGSLSGAATTSSLDNCDGCTQNITLPFEFLWLGVYPVTEVLVSTNGFIYVDSDNDPEGAGNIVCSTCPLIDPNSTLPLGRIAVIHEDIDPGDYGTIYYYHDTTSSPESFVISWEGSAFFVSHGQVNAQAVLYVQFIPALSVRLNRNRLYFSIQKLFILCTVVVTF